MPSQASELAQLVPVATGVWVTPATASHASVVHGFPSSVGSGVPGVQAPDSHVSEPLHTVASLQAVPFGFSGFEQVPLEGLHAPASWHSSLAAQVTGVPAVHVPAWQVSPCVQAFSSLHAVPSETGVWVTPLD
jgi:hypothetical protein